MQVHEMVDQIQLDLLDMETGVRGFVISGKDAYLQPYEQGMSRWENDVSQLSALIADNESQQTNLRSIKSDIRTWLETNAEKLIDLKKQDASGEWNKLFESETGKREMDSLRSQLSSFKETEQELTSERIAGIKSRNQALIASFYLLWIVVALLLIGVGWFVAGTLIRNIRQVSATLRNLATKGQSMEERVKLNTRDEMRELGEATNLLLDRLETDNLGKMRIAEVATLLQGQHDLETVARLFVDKAAEIFEAPYAVLYSATSGRQLIKLASFAGTSGALGMASEFGRSAFEWGEGLVGECAEQNRTLVIRDLPDTYAVVQSGIGQAAPKELVVAPIEFERSVIGVLELGSFRELNKEERELLQEMLVMAGISLQSVSRRKEIEQLYAESQAANEELQAQSEELNAQSLELLTMNDELKRASTFKSEFLANMSHELRTPLNSMLILSQMLAENRDGRMSEEDVHFVRTIHSAGNDLLNLINDILDLSKVEAGKLEVELGPVVLSELVQTLYDEYAGVAEQKRLEFRIETTGDVPAWIETDGFRMQQILRNLLSNAFKFTESGSVELSVRLHRARDWGLDELVFAVRDTGKGISREKYDYIFEAFTQADSGTARKYGGTGLGLKISQQLAGLLGGRIEMESEVDRGSVFELYLPMSREGSSGLERGEPAGSRHEAAASSDGMATAAETRPDPETVKRLSGKKALLVDDDARNLFALSNLLGTMEMDVSIAHDGLECLERLESENFDIILMDVMMPDLDGLQTIRQIREHLLLDIPILAVTAKAMKEDKEKCLQAGAGGYVSKPIQVDELIREMLNLLD
nr:CHASE3 domain-containing protein [Cohnella zeiphila]